MSIYGTLAGLMNVEARTNLLNQQAVDFGMLAQERQQKMASDRILQDAIQRMGTDQQAQQVAPVSGIDQEELQGPMGQLAQQISGLQTQSNQLQTLARTPRIAPDRALELNKQAFEVQKAVATETTNLLKERADLYQKMGDIAGGPAASKTQDAVDLAVAQMRRLDPATLNRLPVDRDPISGRVMATPRTIDTFATFADQSLKQKDRIEIAQRAQGEQDRTAQAAANLEERTRHNQEMAASTAASRAGIEATKEASREQRAYSLAQQVQNEYKTDDQVKQFADHKKMYLTGYNYVYDSEGKVKPEGAPGTPEWSNHDSASDYELSKQFIAMTHPHYRGTTADAKEIAKLPNIPERLANMIAATAGGKLLAQSDRVNMVNAMKNVIANENEDQLQREDKALKRVSNLSQGTDLPIPINPEDYVTLYAFRPAKGGETPAETVTKPTTAGTGTTKTSGVISSANAATGPVIPENQREDVAKKLNAAGIDYSITDGKIHKAGGPVTVMNKTQRDALPPGTPYLKPGDKTVWIR